MLLLRRLLPMPGMLPMLTQLVRGGSFYAAPLLTCVRALWRGQALADGSHTGGGNLTTLGRGAGCNAHWPDSYDWTEPQV